MSWKNRIDNIQFSITTGDGKVFFPLWKTGENSFDFNTSVFDFINVPGSYGDRKQPKGNKYPLTFWFQGDDNIDQTDSFIKSSKDSRLWTIIHPFYGTIKGHPISISRNDENFNLTAISVDFIESIDVDYPSQNFGIKDNSLVRKNAILDSCSETYASTNTLKVEDISKNKDSAALIDSSFKDLQDEHTAPDYSNAFAISKKANDNLIDSPLDAIKSIQTLIDLPSTYDNPVLQRINSYINCYNKLKKTLLTVADKLFFETQQASVISSYCNAALNPVDGDFQIYDDVVFVGNNLVSIYNDYLSTIDNVSTDNYSGTNIYQPSPIVQSQLNDLVYFTLENLFALAFETKQERIIYTPKSTNLILLVHQYLGLDANDSNIEQFRQINNLKSNLLFEVPKGTKIKYYV